MARLITIVFVFALAFSEAGFAQSNSSGVNSFQGSGVEPPEHMLLQEGTAVGDVVLPKGTKVNDKKSLIVGTDDNSFGKVVAKVSASSELVVKFFKDNLPDKGWELISEAQDKDTTLTFQKPLRVVTVVVERSRARAKVRMMITPRS